MKRNYFLIFLLLISMLPLAAQSAILPVPGVYSTIQSAINASAAGDTVLVDPGVYYENLNMNGKNILLCSAFLTTGNSTYISSTILDGGQAGRVLTIASGEDSTCRITGFTIRNGNSSSEPSLTYGGGVLIDYSSPVISHCVIENNTAPAYGGGIAINGDQSNARVMNSTIRNNTADSFGGGLFMGDCGPDAEVSNSIITGNTITCNCNFGGGGGGVNLYHSAKISNCLIYNNSAPNSSVGGGGVMCDWGDYYGAQGVFVTGCTIVNNTALENGGVGYVITGGEFRNCIIWGNTDQYGNPSNYNGNTFLYTCSYPAPAGTGNFQSDPGFVNPAMQNFRLQSSSLCINAGNDSYNSQTFDLDGNPRLAGVIDLGAYEFGSIPETTVQIGSGSDYTDLLPVYTCDRYSYSQQIYHAGEIASGGGSPGYISKVRFHYLGGDNGFGGWNDWAVYLGNTAKSTFANTADWVSIDSLSLVFSGIVPIPGPGNWMEVILSQPFYYTGGNLLVAIDENSNGYDCTALWATFYSGESRGLIVTDWSVNLSPASPPPANFWEQYSINQIQLGFTDAFGVVEGYVYRQPACTDSVPGAVVSAGSYSAVTDSTGFFRLVVAAGAYAQILASDGQVNQSVSPLYITAGDTLSMDFCLPLYFAPPVQPEAVLTGALQDNAHLTWKEPGSVADQWIHWDSGITGGSLGYGDYTTTFSVAARWAMEDLPAYTGTYLKKIRFFPAEATAQYTLKVWKGPNAGTLLHSQPVSGLHIGAINDIALTVPVLIDGTDEFWFGYEVSQTQGYPAGLASGPAVAGKGDMFSSGGPWFSVKESWNYDFNWLIQGFISEDPVPFQPVRAMNIGKATVVPDRAEARALPPPIPGVKYLQGPAGPEAPVMPSVPVSSAPASPPASLTDAVVLVGYNIYRNNTLIADSVTGLSFDDPSLPKGTYDYHVSALYDMGESALAGPVRVQVYTCFPPTGFTTVGGSLTTTSAGLTWTPSVLSTQPEWVLEWGTKGFLRGTGTSAHVMTSPAYTLTGLNPGQEYDVYLATFCSAADTSAWQKLTIRTHYFDCPVTAIAEAEPCGDTINNGCSMPVPAYETITPGDTVCGTVWLYLQARDSDWYTFSLTDTSDVTIRFKSEFPARIRLLSDVCPLPDNLATGYPSPPWETTLFYQAPPGTYRIEVVPNYNGTVSCDSVNRYLLSLTASDCLIPVNLYSDNINSGSADLHWSSGGVTWDIEWGPSGFTPGSGNLINGITQIPYTLTGLSEGLHYDFYVRTDCGDNIYSAWAGPHTFFLPCPPTSLPYSEDFSTHPYYQTPLCWQHMGEGQPSNWTVSDSYNAGGESPELQFNTYPYTFGSNRIVSPALNTQGRNELNLSFDFYRNSNGNYTSFEVQTTSDGGVTWNTVFILNGPGVTGPTTEYITITNEDVGSANFRLAFVVTGYSWDLATLVIDDIYIDGFLMTGDLDGYVYDCNNSNPLEGVMVKAGTETTYTDINGYFAFFNLPQGSYDVVSSLAGYINDTVHQVQVWYGQTTGISTCMFPDGPPVNRTLGNTTLSAGQVQCYDALQTITVAGGGTTFQVLSGGSATLIAGQNIRFLPGTRVFGGGYLLGKIAPSGPFCNPADAPLAQNDPTVTGPLQPGSDDLRVYPNPTRGEFILELRNTGSETRFNAEVRTMQGTRILTAESVHGKAVTLSLAGYPAGIYLVRVTAGDRVYSARVVRMP